MNLVNNKVDYQLTTHDDFIFYYTKGIFLQEVKHFFKKPKIPNPTVIKDLEFTILSQPIKGIEKNILWAKTINIITNFYNQPDRKEEGFNNCLHKNYYLTIKYLEQHTELLVGKTDKENSTVEMYKSEYYAQMAVILGLYDENVQDRQNVEISTRSQDVNWFPQKR